MGQLSRNEARLLHGATAASIEDHMALGIGRLAPAGIDEHLQLADLAAGREGGQHAEGEGHQGTAKGVSV